MTIHTPVGCCLLASASLLLLASDLPCLAADVALVLQEGRPGCGDVQDVHVSVDPALSDRNLGGMHFIGIWSDSQPALIRFDLSAIPAGAKVMSASLELFCVSVGFSDEEIQRSWAVGIYECRHEWTEGTGHDQIVRSDGATVSTFDGTAPWPPGGVTATAGDRIAVTSHLGGETRWYVWELKADIIQAWIDGSRPNHGFVVWGKAPGKAVSFASSETTTAENRPRLRLTLSLSPAAADELAARFPTEITWEEYRSDCGVAAQEANEARTEEAFRRQYHRQVVEWSGRVESVSEGFRGGYRIGIRMNPTDCVLPGSDLVLIGSARVQQQALNLRQGQNVRFVGRILSQGGTLTLHTIELLKMVVSE